MYLEDPLEKTNSS
ncbi:hypothetical protein LINPERHAP1_LOCUS36976 [Linum perenne]